MRNRLSSLIPVAALLSVIVFGPAHSQPSDAMKACLGRGGVTFDQRTAACSSIIEAGTELNENLALAYGNRGHVRVFRKEVEAARKDFEESIRRDPSSASAHRFRGNLFLLDTDERKASEAYRKAIEIDPKLGPAYASLGAMAARRGAASTAIEFLDKSIEFEPDDLTTYLMRGHARIQTEEYDQAIADFTAAVKGPPPPERAEALFGRGGAFAHKGEHQKALADFDEGLGLKADRGEAFAIRCVIRAALGQAFDAVMTDCDTALTLPSNGVAVPEFPGLCLPQAR